jgi:hypothetical protein
MFVTESEAPAGSVVPQLSALVDELQHLDLTSCTDDEVLDLLREPETQKRRLAAVDHLLITEVEQRHLPYERGCASATALLMQLLRLHSEEAAARVHAADEFGPRRSLTGEPLPPIFEATAAVSATGAISPRHAAVITDAISKLPAAIQAELDVTVERILLEHARELNPRQLRLAANDLRAALDQDGILADERDRRRRRHLTIHQRPDGSAYGSFDVEAPCAEALLAVTNTFARPAPAEDGAPDPRTPGQRRHDALQDGLFIAIRSGELPDCGGVAATIMLTMTPEQFESGQGVVTTGHGAHISAQLARTLLGDAQIIPVVLGKAKNIEAYGDTHRIFTKNQRLAMIARDGGCTFPGCSAPPAWCQAHHVTDFHLTRHTRVDDGALVCGFHHREHPNLGWQSIMLDGIPHWTPPRWIDPTQTPRRNRMHQPSLELV